MLKKFNPGDIVRLKSGGPDMTVSSYNSKDEGVGCMWFNDGDVKVRFFSPEVLTFKPESKYDEEGWLKNQPTEIPYTLTEPSPFESKR